MKKKLYTALSLLLLLAGTGCERDNDIDIPEAGNFRVVEESACIGDIITVTGENMHLVTKFRFGSTDTKVITLPADRSREKLFVTVPSCVKEDGPVELSLFYNSIQRMVLNPAFMVYVKKPVPTTQEALAGSKTHSVQ